MTARKPVRLSAITANGGTTLERALVSFVSWHLELMDLWGGLGMAPSLDLLGRDGAARVAAALDRAGVGCHALASAVFGGTVAIGAEQFRADGLAELDRVLEIAAVVRPRYVRLLAAQAPGSREHDGNAVGRLRESDPWLGPLYREAADRIVSAGFDVTIENETKQSFLSSPQEYLDFADWIGNPGRVFTWDIQNAWQTGTAPSVSVFRELEPVVGYVHLKGGRADEAGQLCWASDLASASWPVGEVVHAVLESAASPVLCLNPSHGKVPEETAASVEELTLTTTWSDIRYLRDLPGVL